jgi:hypothetical protein
MLTASPYFKIALQKQGHDENVLLQYDHMLNHETLLEDFLYFIPQLVILKRGATQFWPILKKFR